MKKILSLLLTLLLLISLFIPALAEEYTEYEYDDGETDEELDGESDEESFEDYYGYREYCFELSSDEMFEINASPEDIVTIELRLLRTDCDEKAEMYCFQDEIHYDGSVFELVEDSFELADGVNAVSIPDKDPENEEEDTEAGTEAEAEAEEDLSDTVSEEESDIIEEDEEEEEDTNDSVIKIDYILPEEVEEWESDTFVASFKLKALVNCDYSFITNENAFVSTEDGLAVYDSTCVDIVATIGEIMDPVYTVIFLPLNGEESNETVADEGTLIEKPEDPFAVGFEFTGWYTDEECTHLWDFENDHVEQDMILYAGWQAPKVTDGMFMFAGILLLAATAAIVTVVLIIRKKTR